MDSAIAVFLLALQLSSEEVVCSNRKISEYSHVRETPVEVDPACTIKIISSLGKPVEEPTAS